MSGIFIIILIMFAPPIVFITLGFNEKNNRKRAKTYYIVAVAYLIIGLGTCAAILNNLEIH